MSCPDCNDKGYIDLFTGSVKCTHPSHNRTKEIPALATDEEWSVPVRTQFLDEGSYQVEITEVRNVVSRTGKEFLAVEMDVLSAEHCSVSVPGRKAQWVIGPTHAQEEFRSAGGKAGAKLNVTVRTIPGKYRPDRSFRLAQWNRSLEEPAHTSEEEESWLDKAGDLFEAAGAPPGCIFESHYQISKEFYRGIVARTNLAEGLEPKDSYDVVSFIVRRKKDGALINFSSQCPLFRLRFSEMEWC